MYFIYYWLLLGTELSGWYKIKTFCTKQQYAFIIYEISGK